MKSYLLYFLCTVLLIGLVFLLFLFLLPYALLSLAIRAVDGIMEFIWNTFRDVIDLAVGHDHPYNEILDKLDELR